MKKVPFIVTNEINVSNIIGYFEKRVSKFGTGAKVDIPKEYLGRKVVILVSKD
jgi:putative transposon-encoded protein